MNAFSAGLDAIFADPNFMSAATYQSPVGAVQVPCTVLFVTPDAVFGTGLAVNTVSRQVDIRVTEIPLVEEGGIVVIAGQAYRIRGVSQPDDQRFLWRCGLAPVKG